MIRLPYLVDLTRRHFPNRRANRHALLANENNFPITSHRRNNDGCLAAHNRPSARCLARRGSDVIGDDLEMRVPEMSLTRNCCPPFSIVHEIALFHAANCSGRRPQRQTASARAAVAPYLSRSNLRQRAIWAAMFPGAGAPMAALAASERRTSNKFATSTSNNDETFFSSAIGI